MLQAYQQRIIDLFTYNQMRSEKSLTKGDKVEVYTDHLKTITELELEESIRVVTAAIDKALGTDYAKKNPSLIASMIPHVLEDVRSYTRRFEAQYHNILMSIHPDVRHTNSNEMD